MDTFINIIMFLLDKIGIILAVILLIILIVGMISPKTIYKEEDIKDSSHPRAILFATDVIMLVVIGFISPTVRTFTGILLAVSISAWCIGAMIFPNKISPGIKKGRKIIVPLIAIALLAIVNYYVPVNKMWLQVTASDNKTNSASYTSSTASDNTKASKQSSEENRAFINELGLNEDQLENVKKAFASVGVNNVTQIGHVVSFDNEFGTLENSGIIGYYVKATGIHTLAIQLEMNPNKTVRSIYYESSSASDRSNNYGHILLYRDGQVLESANSFDIYGYRKNDPAPRETKNYDVNYVNGHWVDDSGHILAY